ncbi:CDF family Co(II)/Ni(II) efflux transporter DmeF [Candidatus Pelagisphaera phototrophica]|uniref:CDF family Co(II)/Ni(II) efflux transporter DmeF n=1 Tax=Candidatus Pelagisphaera phototrophica TaxID=2684113 RepID=UPI0019DDC925|nr:CDF family Co(II)/Ni(II) efflux transporter DmeF [Candidatus Pelagisphaera phototrophica]QXD30891.1 CDF family Co(II)/Ni(II) efflux transporter DmeF [Candidatus Pelagisphaera phototrophica]
MRAHGDNHEMLIGHKRGERSTKIVIAITAIMMVGEIVSGILFGSMALLADGWHMSTHVAAFSITLFAYWYARRHADNPFYKFGTGKVSVLGGFASAVALVVVAFVMGLESVGRFFSPEQILFDEAIIVAIIGLIVNLGCAKILHDSGHGHSHSHIHDETDDHPHSHQGHEDHHHHDHNLKAAYLHVLADALTSVFAIVALTAGKFYGLLWLDALMGIVGAVVITKWAWGLLRETSSILLDGGEYGKKEAEIRELVASSGQAVTPSIRLWKIAPQHFAATIHASGSLDQLKGIRSRLQQVPWITYSSIEIEVERGDKDSGPAMGPDLLKK